jgi:hypothetical protein
MVSRSSASMARWASSFATNESAAGSAVVLSISIDAVSTRVVGETD